jgi:hypothetical protein
MGQERAPTVSGRLSHCRPNSDIGICEVKARGEWVAPPTPVTPPRRLLPGWRGIFIHSPPGTSRTRRRRLARGLVAVSVHASTSPGVGPHVVAEPKFLLPVVVLPELLLGEDCHGQADQRVAAADLHGRVHRERHICRNPAPLGRRPNLVPRRSFVCCDRVRGSGCPSISGGRSPKQGERNPDLLCRRANVL